MPFKSEKQRKWMWANDPKMAKDWEKKKKTEVSFSKVSTEKLLRHYKQMADERLSGSAALTFRLIAKELNKRKVKLPESVNEAERDYKDEYKKFQSSTKAKKYRAELNKYNRKKGTYGNGDGKDA